VGPGYIGCGRRICAWFAKTFVSLVSDLPHTQDRHHFWEGQAALHLRHNAYHFDTKRGNAVKSGWAWQFCDNRVNSGVADRSARGTLIPCRYLQGVHV